MRALSFDDWIPGVFDHPAEQPHWYFRPDADWWHAHPEPAQTAAYVVRLFENLPTLAAPYSDAQINNGLWFVLSNGGADCMRVFGDARVAWPLRQRCFAAMSVVFADFFAVRCSPHLSHTQRTGLEYPDINPLNSVCYMWWDMDWIVARPDTPEGRRIDLLALEVMESTIQLDALACQESALHGLGHWQQAYPARVEKIIDRFLASRSAVSAELKQYALAARGGCVL
ncbi:MAG: hypothetical protein HXY40_02500 [Chloroflexi bacterium]|nr:hypothetical protein [Chloroflexota bacterium]